jgi:leucyl aminopeptidase
MLTERPGGTVWAPLQHRRCGQTGQKSAHRQCLPDPHHALLIAGWMAAGLGRHRPDMNALHEQPARHHPADPATPDLVQPDRGQRDHDPPVDKAVRWLAGRIDRGTARGLTGAKFKGEAGAQAIIPDGDGWAVAAGVADVEAAGKLVPRAAGRDLAPPGPIGSPARAKPARRLPSSAGRWGNIASTVSRRGQGGRTAHPADHAGQADRRRPGEAEAVSLVRDLVNTGAEHMGPAELEHEVEHLAHQFRAQVRVTRGEVLEHEYRCVHMVGRAAARSHAPRLIELEWGDEKAPRLAIVGKGVCFDSGGLDIKPASGMLLMKKDMGGGGPCHRLARLVMQAGLKVRLHLVIRRWRMPSRAMPSAPATC